MITEKILIWLPTIVLISSLGYGIFKCNYFFIFLSIGLLICALLAWYLKLLMPKKELFLRPTDDPCKCDLFSKNCPGIKKSGMPSGHAALMIFFVVMMFLYYKKINYQIIFFLILALAVIYQRYDSKCHNFVQLIMGSIVGALFAIFFFLLIMK